MVRFLRRRSLAQVCSAALTALAFASLPALAANADGERSHKAAKKRSNKVKIQHTRSSSEETTAERDRRLYRECQGRPNSGACAGYARKR
ncbi:hypothetical protein [Comamonas testosteroni]|uniref:Uncharacterized protein n=1 Tax=Comamonas testosteroni (strain DSM 14576 / KF-1) TaxID=399795 RepID=B7WRV5_COMTK|nr:hypothetical protein [Comamonas testosteroni]EED69009.1 conserved hypothetical protein [Comamonas testosteroni KF-1]